MSLANAEPGEAVSIECFLKHTFWFANFIIIFIRKDRSIIYFDMISSVAIPFLILVFWLIYKLFSK